MAKYFLTNKAVEDLSKIWDYTYEVWSENQADKYYMMLIDSCKQVSEHPDMGKNYHEIGHDILGLEAGKHIIFYRITKSAEIEVLRILHGRMDLKNRLQD
ncbi:MAG: plasmid stabilization protein [Ferruginibacter sp.]|nr:plasmid stabilization protein [Ferruginibacter sp.]